MTELTIALSDRFTAALDRRAGSTTDAQRVQWILRALRNELRPELDAAKHDIADAIQRLPKADRDAVAAKIGMAIPASAEA